MRRSIFRIMCVEMHYRLEVPGKPLAPGSDPRLRAPRLGSRHHLGSLVGLLVVPSGILPTASIIDMQLLESPAMACRWRRMYHVPFVYL